MMLFVQEMLLILLLPGVALFFCGANEDADAQPIRKRTLLKHLSSSSSDSSSQLRGGSSYAESFDPFMGLPRELTEDFFAMSMSISTSVSLSMSMGKNNDFSMPTYMPSTVVNMSILNTEVDQSMSITSTVTVTETIDIIEMSITSTVTEVDQSMSITSTITETTPTAKADKKPAQNTEDV